MAGADVAQAENTVGTTRGKSHKLKIWGVNCNALGTIEGDTDQE